MTLQAVEPSSCAGDWLQVNPADLPATWPEYRPLILRLLKTGDGCFDERDILAMLLMERWQLRISSNGLAIGITEVLEFPRKRVLLLRYAAGDKDTLVAGQNYMNDLARALHCTEIEIYGRIGWERVLPDWTRTRTVLRKEVL